MAFQSKGEARKQGISSWSVQDFENDEDIREGLENARLDIIVDKGKHGFERFCSWEIENYDKSTSVPQSLEEEFKRLKALKLYKILDTDKDQKFERFTSLASRLFHAPIALISIVDMGRQWFLSSHGINIVQTPRNQSFCAHAILSTQDLLVVPDATEDTRFKDNPLVTGDPNIRFYAGAPLISSEGYKLGTLCIMDTKSRPQGLSLFDKQNLREISDLVVDNLVQRREEIDRTSENVRKVIACTAHDLLTPLFGIQLNLSLLMDDSSLWLSMKDQQKEMIESASQCTEMMSRMCHTTIDFYRDNFEKTTPLSRGNVFSSKSHQRLGLQEEDKNIVITLRLVNNLRLAIEAYPKRVPIYINIAEDVPSIFQGDEVKILSSVLNYLTNACQCTEEGAINLRIFAETKDHMKYGKLRKLKENNNSLTPRDHLAFEVEDTGPGINLLLYPDLFSSLSLASVATHVSSLGGEYGFLTKETYQSSLRKVHSERSFNIDPSNLNLNLRKLHSFGTKKYLSGNKMTIPSSASGSIFWFSVPIILAPFTVVEKNRKKKPQFFSNERFFHIDKKSETVGEKNIFLNPTTTKIKNKSIDTNVISKPDVKTQFSKVNQSDIPPKVSQLYDLTLRRTEKCSSNSSSNDRTVSSPITSENAKNLRCKKALVIDDSIIIRKSVDRALKSLGFKVVQAQNGMVGLNELKGATFDIAFCDFLMPIMDGLDCVQQFRTWEKSNRPWFHQYIIGISAHASTNDADCGLTKGMDKFQSKPLLLKTIKELAMNSEVTAGSLLLDKKFNKSHTNLDTYANTDNNAELEEDIDSVPEVSKEAVKTIQSSGLVCLIAAESKSIGKTLEHSTRKRGYETIWVGNGEDALSLLKMRNWVIVFLDDQMAKLSGMSCVTRFRQWESRNRIVRQNNIYLISGQNHESSSLGFDGVLQKPLKHKHLYKILDQAKNTESEILLRSH